MQSSFFRNPAALLTALAAAVLAVAAPLAARADGDAAANAGVGVARISLIQGSVAVQRGDSATSTAAVINAPVLGADYVTTGDGSRAEIQFDAASAVRLGGNVQMRFTHLDAGDRDLQLAEGTIDLRLLRADSGRSQIDTPSISVRPRGSGSYRVTVDASGTTLVTVRAGAADVLTPQGAEVLGTGTTLLARGAAANPSVQHVDAIASDDFDRFNGDRDQRELAALANAYAPAVAGIDDLAAYGRWVTDPGYGSVWAPSYVAPGWAPYRDGRWAWEDGYGWTWIGYEPWGWAPYHYGRWYHSPQYGWCWYPVRSAAWSPALVTFFAGSGGFGFGFGTIGWVPLAPFEPFQPWWGYGNRTTIVNVTNNYYANGGAGNFGDHRRHRRDGGDWQLARKFSRNAQDGAATVVSKQRFLEGRFEHPVALRADQMRSLQVVRGAVPLVPTAANLRYSNRPVAAPLAVHVTTLQQEFAGNRAPVRRMPIDQQRSALAAMTRPAQVRTVQHTATATATVRTNTQTTAAHGDAANDGASAATARAVPADASAVKANANAARENAVNPRDPWARFAPNHAGPVGHNVTVTDGASGAGVPVVGGAAATGAAAAAANAARPAAQTRAAGANAARSVHDSDAWNRFDAAAASRPKAVREQPSARDAGASAPRATTVTAPSPRSYGGERREVPANSAPRPAQNAAPAHAAPSHTESHPDRSTSTPHH